MKENNPNKITDSDPYQLDNVPLYKAIYGENLISLGGLAAVDNMFSRINIRGLKALDIGFGLGGVAFYLAEKYGMKVAGVEIYPWMVRHADEHRPRNLINSLEFNTYTSAGELPYKPETFDLVYSKGVLNHVADKVSLFKQIYSVLKPKGLFVIADWIYPTAAVESIMPLVSETKESYERVLVEAGFNQVNFRNDSSLFLSYVKEFLNNLANKREFIQQKYGEELYLIIQKQHEALIEKIHHQQKMAVRIVARKTCPNPNSFTPEHGV